MADASGISEDALAWTSQWYLRHDTLRAGQHPAGQRPPRAPARRSCGAAGRCHPPTGSGSRSAAAASPPAHCRGTSSMRAPPPIPTSPTSTPPTAPRSSRPPGARPSPCSTRSSATQRICRSASTPSTPPDKPLRRSRSSTSPGLQFSPRIRDIGRLQLYRFGPGSAWRSRYPHAGRLLAQPIQTQLIAEHWNDLLRLVASMKFGHTTASLLIAKLHASSRQSALAKALHEYGRLIRTLYVCRYVDRRRTSSPRPTTAQQGRELCMRSGATSSSPT